ncbi:MULTISPECIES: DUF937 domain-containing protein [Bosea]|uniref:DUF937 domain-containing protein n=1 Tax=Bosea TaxID=85413 RepID=UPI00214F6BA7|nr:MULTISPECIES: DUF937 domain-containing protein [Bosea]MCR4521288.1 DUF937 domain-containing protein [Bosea sp. 47.2.35]MDR6826712.1 hypothetical protein [Bosea robiniae]MDR6893422.1 hypothetical protein [Bosea sp. BE109]MDR7136879.1 hypothetical protein [Bosea sp. BE168]MDR7173578.1 hypothetical protein [Bosea sp. BE271]
MMNLFDIMQSAQHGQALPNLAQQYGLSLQQTQAALDALLPAFSMGLQRQTRDPYAFGSLAQMMTASPYARFFEAGGYGIPAGAQTAGNDVLSQLFGSREVSQAIAAQAAATSGVSQAILKQMLPVIAAMLMGGLSKTSSNEGLGGILGQFAEMMRGQMPGMQPAPPQQPQMPANPFEAILKGMFGQAGGQPQPTPQASPSDPFGGALGQILGGMFGGLAPQQPEPEPAPRPRSAPRRAPEPEPEETAPSSSANGPGSIGLDALNQMFEHGRQIQDDHQNALKSILDAMLGGGQGRR